MSHLTATEPMASGELAAPGDYTTPGDHTAPDDLMAPEPIDLAQERLRRGLLALRREEFELALVELEAAVALAPNRSDAFAYLSGALLALGRPEEARDAVDRALELDPGRFAAQQKAGELSLRLGDSPQAAEHFLSAVRAATPGSADEFAARAALAIARRQVRSGIDRHAILPRLPSWRAGPSRLRATIGRVAGRWRRSGESPASG